MRRSHSGGNRDRDSIVYPGESAIRENVLCDSFIL